jgi:mRNA interferase HicA
LLGGCLLRSHATTKAVVAGVAIRTYLCDNLPMNGHEFERKIRSLGRKRGILVSFDAGHGKGSHGRLYYGNRFTTLKDRRKEIGPGLLKAMLDQLGVTKKDLESN